MSYLFTNAVVKSREKRKPSGEDAPLQSGSDTAILGDGRLLTLQIRWLRKSGYCAKTGGVTKRPVHPETSTHESLGGAALKEGNFDQSPNE